MIIDNSQSNIEVVGDVKEFKTSIDPRNLEFITTLLSSNLYSNPEQSFIREIVSNAWDSHVEAGTTNVPVIIRLKDGSYEKSVTIRDYGTGLSPERFKEVYCNIGSSTKRDSNDYIGGFGIGKYSSLACSNSVYITSYYEGTAYYYLMVKSGNSITTNLLMEKPTTEKNGVEVTIKNVPDMTPFIKALDYIVFFPNIYVDGAGENINSAKLKRFNNFACASIKTENKLLLGNVLYPCNRYQFGYEVRNFLDNISNTGIVVKFNVGEINITPNRESIIYTEDTKKKIESRILSAKNEIESLITDKFNGDYDDISEYYKIMGRKVVYDPLTDELVQYGGYLVEPKRLRQVNVTFRGENLLQDIDLVGSVLRYGLPNFRGLSEYGRIFKKKPSYSTYKYNCTQSKNILMLGYKVRVTAVAQSYIRENFDSYAIITEFTKDELRSHVEEGLKTMFLTAKHPDLIIDGAFDLIMKNAIKLDVDTDANFLDYKAKLAEKKTSPAMLKETILYDWSNNSYREKKTFTKFSNAIKFLKDMKKGVVLIGMDMDGSSVSNIASVKGYVCIQARKDIVSELRNMGLKCLVDLDWLLNKDPMLLKVKTVMEEIPEGINAAELSALCPYVPADLAKEFRNISHFSNIGRNNIGYRNLVNKQTGRDDYTAYICRKYIHYMRSWIKAKTIVKEGGAGSVPSSDLTAAVVLRSRAFRVSYSSYKKIKTNKLINILCRKS